DRALQIDPQFAEALVDRALVELELDQLDQARDDLTRAHALGRHDLVVTVALGETLARLGRRADAEAVFAERLAPDPDTAGAPSGSPTIRTTRWPESPVE